MPDHPFFSQGNLRGIGIDLVLVSRVEKHLQDKRFLQRIFTSQELEDAGAGPSQASRLAGRIAAKEATSKALGCGIGPNLGWKDVEVVRSENGAPAIRLSAESSTRHGNPIMLVSISHDGDYATAVVACLEAGADQAGSVN